MYVNSSHLTDPRRSPVVQMYDRSWLITQRNARRIAGGETTATSLAATLYYVLKTPSVLAKLTDEIRGRYNSHEDINANTALQLPYLQAVINETLRVHPSGAHGFPRLSPGGTVDGHWVPAGVSSHHFCLYRLGNTLEGVGLTDLMVQTEVYTSTWSVSHDRRYFANPDTFNPARWTDPECKDLKEASQPFSLGLRACIGRR